MRADRFLAMAACIAAFAGAGAVQAQAPSPLLGFTAKASADERSLEHVFDGGLDAAEQRDWLRQMASRPNQVGGPHDKVNADWMRDQFKAWGWDARIETFYVLYPTPLHLSLQLQGDSPFTAALHEPPVAGDASSAITENVLPPYLAYQGDGDVTAAVVYANYGMPDDYRALERAGVDFRGKIILARYGGGWRGLKPLLAQQHGAVGCLIYSDPADDGYGPADPYPRGGSRPPDGVQRGSVAEMMIYPGDPLTPDVGATRDAPRLTRATAPTILKIPALPISYADALPFLQAMGGPVAPKSFRGQLPLTYHFGPTAAKAHLIVQSDWSLKPIYDVIAVIPGSASPDQWVIRGNHHDGWVFGAWDPLAGNVAMLEEAKSIGGLLKTGWRPKRTIVYASWDAEEPGLIGSTEWAEQHATELKAKAVAYINSDTNARGFLRAQASHDLQRLINEVAADVQDPETRASVQTRWRAHEAVAAYTDPRQGERPAPNGDLAVGALGSGSDYSAFLQHLGLASINLEYSGEDQQEGVYHSLYDTFEHFSRFGDPSFDYGVALSETAGRLVLREADADVLPMQFTDFADTIAGYVEEVKKILSDARERTEAQSKLMSDHAFALDADPSKPQTPAAADPSPPAMDFDPLKRASAHLTSSAHAYDQALAAQSGALPPARAAELNARLQGVDQALLDTRGLPGRPWFKNLAYAPGVLTGYGAKTLPGVREALEGGRWTEAQDYVLRTAKALDAFADQIDQATALLAHR